MRAFRLDCVKRVLCLGAHADDIEIGAGGTILNLLTERSDVAVHWVVFSGSDERADEARRSAERFLRDCDDVRVDVFGFRDGYFPYVGAEIKDQFEALKKSPSPDLILTHHGEDRHQDHRLISELTWNTFRDQIILEYEIPKFDAGLGSPNVFMELSRTTFQRKLDILMEVFSTQRSRRWFNVENFEALARLRGLESNANTGLAEGFHCKKSCISFGEA